MHRRVGTAVFACALLFTVAWPDAAPTQSKSKGGKTAAAMSFGNADAITEDELKTHLYFLASDQMEGRNTPSRGYDTAALYIASHLKQWGLKPIGDPNGADGPLQPYFLPIELVSNQLDAANMELSLVSPPPGRGGRGGAPAGGGRGGGAPAAPAGPRTFEYAREWTAGGGGGGFGGGRGGGAPAAADIPGAQLVFVGNGYVINKTNANPYQGIDVRGRIMVVAGTPPELIEAQRAAAAARGAAAAAGRGGRGGAPQNPLGVENTDYMTPQGYAAKNGALAIITVPTFQQLSAMASPATGGGGRGGGRGGGLNGPPYQVVKFLAGQPPAVPTITAGLELTNALFQGERMSAAQVFEGATANTPLDSFAFNAEKKLSLKIAVTSLRNHSDDVIGILEGSDPVLKNEYVVMSGHLDHVGLTNPDANGDGINNGADDDGSGSVGLMAIAHAFAEGAAKGIRPRRTLIFLWVCGEEKGLWGSQYFNRFPPVDITKVVADLNMDMIGRSKPPGYVDPPSYKLVEPNEILIVGPDISSADLGKTIETVNSSYMKLKLNHFYDVTAPDETHDNLGPQPNGQRIFYRSDHYNFARMGIPIAFFTSGLHPDYHRVTDSPEKIDYHLMQSVAKTVAALAWVLGNQPNRPKLNETLPPQLVNDMKNAQAQGWGNTTPVEPIRK